MEEANQIKIVEIAAGVILTAFYVFTGVDGILLIIAAFLLGFPLDRFIETKKKE